MRYDRIIIKKLCKRSFCYLQIAIINKLCLLNESFTQNKQSRIHPKSHSQSTTTNTFYVKSRFGFRGPPHPLPFRCCPLNGDNKLLAGLEVGALKLRTAFWEAPVEVTGKLLAAGHLDVGTGLDIDLSRLNVARHGGADAFRLVLLIGQHEASGQLVVAFTGVRCKCKRKKNNTMNKKNVNQL